ncbi:hypothetical protein LV85_00010 [Algoriphagus chordae]|uniref:Uncharacterized protein n=1 Tax=Algoriphagus chordae TaxID=237019 RepID=A0A2W7RTE6_9BACT|nr:hypothetical protein LV85_00010 [Algoriphagus chordae]
MGMNELAMALKGDSFNLREFHEQFLSYGIVHVKHIPELMIKE